GLRGKVAQSFSRRPAGPGTLPLARAASHPARLPTGKNPDQSDGNTTGTISGSTPRSPQRRALAISPGVPSDSEEGPDDLPARLRSFLPGESKCGIVHSR